MNSRPFKRPPKEPMVQLVQADETAVSKPPQTVREEVENRIIKQLEATGGSTVQSEANSAPRASELSCDRRDCSGSDAERDNAAIGELALSFTVHNGASPGHYSMPGGLYR